MSPRMRRKEIGGAAQARTFKLGHEVMKGDDVKAWQQTLIDEFKHLGITGVPVVPDGVYGAVTRSVTACLLKASGIGPAAMKDGVTPALRIKLRNRQFTKEEDTRRHATAAKLYRAELKSRWGGGKVHTPATKILADSWGWHPGVHDGLDVIVPPDVPIFAMVKSKVVDVRASGWWGLGAPSNPAVKAKGDGIIQLEVVETVGPFKKGYHVCYGHAEKARVKVGQIVEAGTNIGHAGFANAWHIHLMINDGRQGNRGVGTMDPRPLYNYARKNG
jgi:murein DD-endopeptidase MepM/ murein hydrolase activator NlpD